MKEKIKKYIKEIIVFVVLLTVVSNALSYYRSSDLNKDKLSLKRVKLLDGSDYIIPQDKPVVVHFWATWCPTCKFESVNIETLSKDYEVITIAVQSGSKKDIENYMKDHDLSFKVINDADGFYARKFNIKAYPTTFIYDSNAQLQFTEVGYTTTAGLYARLLLSK